MKTKSLFLVISIVMLFLSIASFAHRDMKNITKGVIYPITDSKSKKELSVKKVIKLGSDKGFYILSPARQYEIRKADKNLIIKFLKKYKSRNVRIQLVIDIRKESTERWKVIKIRKR